MKTVYTIGMVLALSGLAFSGETATKMTQEMAKDAVKKEMTPPVAVPAVPEMPAMGKSMDAGKDAMKKGGPPNAMPPGIAMGSSLDEMSEEELLMPDEEMSPDEMDEEADLLIAEGQALKKRAAEMRAKENLMKGGASMPGGAPKK